MTDQYLEQWERSKRWYERFKETYRGRKHEMSDEYYKDEVYAFFLNCYHLRDWLIEGGTVPAKEVDKFINNCNELKLCADICNASKHLVLNRSLRSGTQPEFTGKSVSLHLGSGPAVISIRYTIETAYGSIDAFDIAKKAMEAWETFFSQNRLQIA